MRKVKSELVEKGFDDKLKIGFCPFKEVYQDALDIYEGYKKTHKNPMYFPGEDNNMKRKNRNVSYRRAYHITGEIEF